MVASIVLHNWYSLPNGSLLSFCLRFNLFSRRAIETRNGQVIAFSTHAPTVFKFDLLFSIRASIQKKKALILLPAVPYNRSASLALRLGDLFSGHFDPRAINLVTSSVCKERLCSAFSCLAHVRPVMHFSSFVKLANQVITFYILIKKLRAT